MASYLPEFYKKFTRLKENGKARLNNKDKSILAGVLCRKIAEDVYGECGTHQDLWDMLIPYIPLHEEEGETIFGDTVVYDSIDGVAIDTVRIGIEKMLQQFQLQQFHQKYIKILKRGKISERWFIVGTFLGGVLGKYIIFKEV